MNDECGKEQKHSEWWWMNDECVVDMYVCVKEQKHSEWCRGRHTSPPSPPPPTIISSLPYPYPPPPYPPATKKQQAAALKAVKGIGGSSGATSGMASSLVFTPTQGR